MKIRVRAITEIDDSKFDSKYLSYRLMKDSIECEIEKMLNDYMRENDIPTYIETVEVIG